MNRLYFICNVFDDPTKIERGITSDSPAAAKKVFSFCRSLISRNVKSIVVSLGRGSTSNTGKFFKTKVSRINSVPTIFLPYWDVFFLSNILTFLVLPFFIFRLNKKKGKIVYLVYNKLQYYLLGLAVGFLLRCRFFLDLEDGFATSASCNPLVHIRNFLLNTMFDFFCKSGVILACSALKSETRITKKITCYGTLDDFIADDFNFNELRLTVLFGGSVCPDTGSELLLSAIKLLRDKNESWAKDINFVITGKGSLSVFSELEKDRTHPRVNLLGSLSQENYQKVLKKVHVGLALKSVNGSLANTTFPSKVIEYASNKKLIITTNISDVEEVLSIGAVYLETNRPQELNEKLKWIVNNRNEAKKIAQLGFDLVSEKLSKEKVGRELKTFLFGGSK